MGSPDSRQNKKMKLLCSVIALAAASTECDGPLCRRKDACTSTPSAGQVLKEQDNSSCSVSADGAASCTCDDDHYFESVEQFNEAGNSTGFADTCYFDACDTDPCAANTDCANDAGSAVCSCSAGFFDYNGDASLCVPDVCGSGDDCSADAACSVELPDVNGTAQWSCECDDGFYGNGVDCWVDSCATGPCQADASCANDGNDYDCSCNSGFYLGADVNGTDFCWGDVCDSA